MSSWQEDNYDPSEHGFHPGVIDGAENFGYPQKYFFADTLRALVIGFGNYFDDIFVIRYNEKGEPIKQIQVPIKYGPRMKSHDFRLEQESGQKYYIPLPNITYKIDSLAFDGGRYAGAGETRGFYSKYFEKNGVDYVLTNKFWGDIQPVPYNITISMEAKCEHMSDANQILEQILVRFAPDSYFDLKEFWWVNIRRSIKMLCESSNIEINTDFGEEDKREITVSFSFKLEAFLYKQVKDSKIIDQIITTINAKNDKDITQKIIGNYSEDNPLKDRYDFSEMLGTKIDYVYKLLPMEDQPKPSATDDSYIQKFEYEQTNEITNYPKDSKLLTTISSCFDTTSALYNELESWLKEYSGTDAVHYYDTKMKKYWELTANSLSPTALSNSGKNIYQIYYKPSYVVKPEELDKYGNVKTSAEYGATIIKEYKNLYGYGNYNSNTIKTGLKDADFGDVIIEDSPYVIKTYTDDEL